VNYKEELKQNELMHFGIMGMRWGKRGSQKAANGSKLVKKVGDSWSKNLENKSKRLSNEEKIKEKAKAEKEYIKKEAKIAEKKGLIVNVERDGVGNVTKVGQAYDSKGHKIGAETAQKILDQVETRQGIKTAVATTAFVVGYGIVMSMLS